MADASWSISNDMAVFETKSSGSFIVSQNTYNSFSNDIRSIGSSVSGYHEYSHHFNTEIEARSIPLSLAREILATHSTPFGTNFAGPGFVNAGNAIGGGIINMISILAAKWLIM